MRRWAGFRSLRMGVLRGDERWDSQYQYCTVDYWLSYYSEMKESALHGI